MTKIFLFILLLFQSNQSYCQEWIRIYGQGLDANAYYIIESYDHGYLIAAQITYGKYLWLIKTDINGEVLWEKKIGTGQLSLSFSPMNIEQTVDNGYIVGGSTTKYGSFDAFILKINSCAEIEWCKVLITPNNFDEGFRVKPTPEGDYLLMGGYFITDPYSNVSLFKFNNMGDLIWHQFYPLDSIYYEDQPYDLLVDTNGYLITTDRYYPDSGTISPAILRHHFIKTDTAGNQVWELIYGVNNHYYGGPWVANKSITGNYYEAGNHFYSNGTGNPAFVKVFNNGNQSYNKDVLSGMTWGGLSSINFLEDSLLVMVGRWYTDLNTPHDGFIKTDTLGNYRDNNEIPLLSSGYWWASKVCDNKFLTIGNDATGGSWKIYAVKVNSDLEYDSIYNQPFTYDSLCPHQIISDTVDPDCDNVYVGIDEPFKDTKTTKLKVFPNPATDHITIEMPKYLVVSNTTSRIPSTTIYHQWGSAILEVYGVFGKKMFEKDVIRAETNLNIEVSAWQPGMYFCRLVFNKQAVASCKVMIE